MKYRNHFITLTCALLIILFSFTGFSKLKNLEEFHVQLGQSPLLTEYALILSWLIPSLEIICAIFLFIPKIQRIALYFSFGLMFLFTGYIFIILRFSPTIPCSCGGIIEAMSWNQHLLLNSFFVTISGIAALLSEKASKVHEETPIQTI